MIRNSAKSFLLKTSALVCLLVNTACGNYTTSPICDDSNSIIPEGLAGSYFIAQQDPNFAVGVQEFEIWSDGKGRMKQRSADGEVVDQRTCKVNGILISEYFVEEAQAYEQRRLFVDSMGITELPMLYDRPSLEAAGIPTKIGDYPQSPEEEKLAWIAARLSQLRNAIDNRALYIHNEGVKSSELLSFGRPAMAGVVMLRK